MLGFWGIFLFIGIMAIQGLIIPIPSEIVLLSTGMIWGILWGGIMGIIGSMAAGFFENNFRDGEVQTTIFVLMGMGLTLLHKRKEVSAKS